ncbi:hypothetical protein TR51_15975 [Kitasatospora griseola]|uniref:Uncharacterized protein n=1 Tax=Kitasatospora griseola TaxID=2064 RepID=A0A0D0NAX0_KITGR|nr:hypothetical protein TR51_15975 [Kitasatospora griseola]
MLVSGGGILRPVEAHAAADALKAFGSQIAAAGGSGPEVHVGAELPLMRGEFDDDSVLGGGRVPDRARVA